MLRDEIAKEICLYCKEPVIDGYGTMPTCTLDNEDRPCDASRKTADQILHLVAEDLRERSRDTTRIQSFISVADEYDKEV